MSISARDGTYPDWDIQRKRVNAMEIFKSSLEMTRETALEINKLVESLGGVRSDRCPLGLVADGIS